MEMLQQQDANLCAAALDLLLAVVAEDAPVLESLCLVGVVPIVNQLTAKNAPGGRPTRSRAASFVELLCSTSGHTVQMFVACGGLAVLVEVRSMQLVLLWSSTVLFVLFWQGLVLHSQAGCTAAYLYVYTLSSICWAINLCRPSLTRPFSQRIVKCVVM